MTDQILPPLPIKLPMPMHPTTAVPISPDDARKRSAGLVIDTSKIYNGGQTIHDNFISSTVEGPPSIVELARALKNNPQLMYQYVHDNIDWEPDWGVSKGPLGCLMDGRGNSFDQSMLLVALLRQAGYTANYVLGTLQLSHIQLAAWFGTDTEANTNAPTNYLSRFNIPFTYWWDGTAYGANMSHVWVQCVISGTTYVFDPSYKQYNFVTGISNLASAMGYVQSSFLSDAETGATIDPSGVFVQNLNDTKIRADLATYSSNLTAYIKANLPAATMDSVVGGGSIIPAVIPQLITALPYEMPGDTQTIWTGDVPASYKTTFEIQFPGIDVTFTTDQLAGTRLTLWFSASNVPTLYLNGTAVGTGTAQTTGSYNLLTQICTHNAYPETYWNQTVESNILTGQYTLIGSSWNLTGRGPVDYHQKQLNAAVAAGGASTAENVLGEALAVIWSQWAAQVSRIDDLYGRISACHLSKAHLFGVIGHSGNGNNGPYCDIGGVIGLGAGLTNAALALPAGMIPKQFMQYSAMECAVLQQIPAVNPSVSTPKVIDKANANGNVIYAATPSNWSGTVSPALTANGYTTAQLNYVDDYVNGWGYAVVHDHPNLPIGSYTWFGAYAFNAPSWTGGGGFIAYGTKGGAPGVAQTPAGTVEAAQSNGANPVPGQAAGATSQEPIDLFRGNYIYQRTDISVGSQPFPYGLSFTRNYNSRDQYKNGPLGRGWTHNYAITATLSSDGLLSMGDQGALQGVPTIVEFYVALDLMNNTSHPLVNTVVAGLCDSWWIDQISFNTVVLQLPDGSQVFVKQPDGSYTPPQGNASKLTLSGGAYTLTSPQGVKMTFNTSGQVTGWTYPSGATVTLSYTSGVLTSIAVLGRTLTLTYTSGYITAVTDGTRTIHYGYDSNNDLTSFTDAATPAEVYTYYYDQPGRMAKYYKPQNPTTAYVTNVYDSLSRVETQANALSEVWTYYFAGVRSEEDDPIGNAHVRYFNQFGAVTRDINALGFETDYVYDGLNRRTQVTLPEGNQTLWTYDSNNNVLTTTFVPKVGSGLANVVNTFTYDPTWAKVKTAQDGRLNTTTYTYDPTLGNLLKIQRPAVNGIVPTVTYGYNARGQVTSVIDETGIQTQNNYDTASEKRLSSILNTNWQATISGTATVGNVLTLTAHDASLSGGQEAVTYTVKTGDTLTSMASGLAAAVNADTKLAAVGIIAYSSASVISLSTAKGNTTTFTESVTTGGTEVITVAAGLNLTTTFGYDAAGNCNSYKDPNLNTTAAVYDNERRLTQVTLPTPFSYVTNITYDLNGNRLTVQRQTGTTPAYQIYTWTYSVTDKVKTYVDPATQTTTWNYDGKDRLKNVIDAMSREYQYAYDALDRLFQTTDPTTTICDTRLYTNNGLLKSIEDARSNITGYNYDGLDRLNETTYADTSYEQNESYDANGNVLTYRTRSGNTVVCTYDALNRLSTKAPASQPTVTYGYDLAGRLTSAAKPVVSGDPSSGSFQNFYDTAGRLNKEEYPDGKLVTSGLDSNGNVTKVTYPDGYYVTRVYDQLNRLTDIKLNGSTASAAHFAYDELSRRTTLTYSSGAVVTYGYSSTVVDDLTSIAHAFVGSSVTYSYGFNNDHEVTSQAVTDNTYMWYPPAAGTVTYGVANSVNEYPTVGGATYSYNTNACLSGDGTWTYTYDTENHLTAASKTGTSVSYLYDSLHRQTQKTVGTTKSYYVYSGWQRLADYDGTAGTLQNRYVHGTGLDEPLIQVTSGGTVTFYHANYQGSIVGVSSSAGAIVNKNSYGPFGEVTAIAGTTFGFTGQRFDTDTGLYYYKLRYYSPLIGRYLQPDSLKYLDDLNLYSYVSNSPISFKDSYGAASEGMTPTSSSDGTPSSSASSGGATASSSSSSPGEADVYDYLDLTLFEIWIPNQWGILEPEPAIYTGSNNSVPPLLAQGMSPEQVEDNRKLNRGDQARELAKRKWELQHKPPRVKTIIGDPNTKQPPAKNIYTTPGGGTPGGGNAPTTQPYTPPANGQPNPAFGSPRT